MCCREILARGDVHDETLAKHLVTVTEVRMSPDLRHATVFVKPLLGKDEEAVLKALRTNTAYLQREVAARVQTEIRREAEVPGRRELRRGQPYRHAAARVRNRWRADLDADRRRRSSDGQALFLLRQHERGEIDHAAAGRFQLSRARHADDAVHRRDRRSLRGGDDHVADRAGAPAIAFDADDRSRGAAIAAGMHARRLACVLVDEAQFLTARAGRAARARLRRRRHAGAGLWPAHRFPGAAVPGSARLLRSPTR